jgi:hypothetical protein
LSKQLIKSHTTQEYINIVTKKLEEEENLSDILYPMSKEILLSIIDIKLINDYAKELCDDIITGCLNIFYDKDKQTLL